LIASMMTGLMHAMLMRCNSWTRRIRPLDRRGASFERDQVAVAF
jgi:hypothetical protein